MDLILKEISGFFQALRYFDLEQAVDKSPYQLNGGQQKFFSS